MLAERVGVQLEVFAILGNERGSAMFQDISQQKTFGHEVLRGSMTT